MTALLQLPAWLGSMLAILGTVAVGVLPFIVVRHLLVRELPQTSDKVAETVAVRIGALHGLILALVFAEAQATHAELRQELSKEATAIEHIAQNLGRWDGPEAGKLREQLTDYVTAVLQNEWHASSRPLGSPEARRAYNALDLSVLDLKAQSPRQETLRAQMIEDMDAVQDHRKVRLSLVHRSLPALFWWVALLGFAITVALFFVFPATLLHVTMLCVYGAYTGLVLYVILALSHPFVGPAAIDPASYAMVLEEIQAR